MMRRAELRREPTPDINQVRAMSRRAERSLKWFVIAFAIVEAVIIGAVLLLRF